MRLDRCAPLVKFLAPADTTIVADPPTSETSSRLSCTGYHLCSTLSFGTVLHAVVIHLIPIVPTYLDSILFTASHCLHAIQWDLEASAAIFC